MRGCRLLFGLSVSLASAHGQIFEVTPLVGGRFGGTVKLEQQGVSPNARGSLDSSVIFGVAGGVRVDEDNLIEFRWTRQSTNLGFTQINPVPPFTTTTLQPNIVINHYLVDFTHEWTLPDHEGLKPFLTTTFGAANLATPASSAARFVFGFGAGLKFFPKPHWGIRAEVEYLPMVMSVSRQSLVCSAGTCVIALGGGVMNQFGVSIGPAFRF